MSDGVFVSSVAGINHFQLYEDEHELRVPVYRICNSTFVQITRNNPLIEDVIKCPTKALEICCYKPETVMNGEEFGDNFAGSINQPSSEIIFVSSTETQNGELLIYSVTENFRDALVRAGK